MKRFFNNEEPDENDFFAEHADDDIDEEELAAAINKEDMLNVMQLDLAQVELNQDLLNRAIEIASKSFFWSFQNNDAKLKEVEKVYRKLQQITNEEEKGEEGKDTNGS